MKLRRNAAFTLLELMIVVSSIALLAVLSLPAFAKARRTSLTQRCILNQRAIWQGVMRYEMDYNRTLHSIRNNGVSVRNVLLNAEYLNPQDSFDCPESAVKDYDDYLLIYSNYDFITISCSVRGNNHRLPN